jgi:hypothetical protein
MWRKCAMTAAGCARDPLGAPSRVGGTVTTALTHTGTTPDARGQRRSRSLAGAYLLLIAAVLLATIIFTPMVVRPVWTLIVGITLPAA